MMPEAEQKLRHGKGWVAESFHGNHGATDDEISTAEWAGNFERRFNEKR
jgi:hypothetical protein